MSEESKESLQVAEVTEIMSLLQAAQLLKKKDSKTANNGSNQSRQGWGKTLGGALLKARSLVDEAEAHIPSVRADIKFVGEDGTMNPHLQILGRVLSRNGVFLDDLDSMRGEILEKFGLKEYENEREIVRVLVTRPDPSSEEQWTEVKQQSDLESAVSVFQAAIKFRRGPIVRHCVGELHGACLAYRTKAESLRREMEAENIDDEESGGPGSPSSAQLLGAVAQPDVQVVESCQIAMHGIWELCLLSPNHTYVLKPKGIVELIKQHIECGTDGASMLSAGVAAASAAWAVLYRRGPGSMNLFAFDIVASLIEGMRQAGKLFYNSKSEQRRLMPTTIAFMTCCSGSLVAASHHPEGRRQLCSQLDKLREIVEYVTDQLQYSLSHNGGLDENPNVHKGATWPFPRTMLQEFLFSSLANCVALEPKVLLSWHSRQFEWTAGRWTVDEL